MNTDLNTVLAQKKKLNQYADNLREVRKTLKQHKDQLDGAWTAKEIDTLNEAIDRLLVRINTVAANLDDLGTDVLKAYQEIAEEERRAREEAERKAREEAEKKAREEAAARAAAASASSAAAASSAASTAVTPSASPTKTSSTTKTSSAASTTKTSSAAKTQSTTKTTQTKNTTEKQIFTKLASLFKKK